MGSTPNDYYLVANTTDARGNAPIWKDEAPTSVYYKTDSSGSVNASETMVCYCFTSIKGFSRFGAYTGNNSTDGPYVVVDDGGSGFKPAWIVIKRVDASNNWQVFNLQTCNG